MARLTQGNKATRQDEAKFHDRLQRRGFTREQISAALERRRTEMAERAERYS